MPTIELCEGCQKEYHKAYLTDDGVRLCSACYIELLKSELSRLETALKVEKQKHLDTSNWAMEQQERADLADLYKSENVELKARLKYAEDYKEIRLKEIEGLETEIADLREALFQHRTDMHQSSKRPCDTCRNSAKALGLTGLVPSGCARGWEIKERELLASIPKEAPNESPPK